MRSRWITGSLILMLISGLLACEKDLEQDLKEPIEGGSYYVSPGGNDDHPGTFSKPWKTWAKAFEMAMAGDTVYFREGNYPSSMGNGGERGFRSGTAVNPICFFNYPGEIPILDCSKNSVENIEYNRGIAIWKVEYLHFKGLKVKNVFQPMISSSQEGNASGLSLYYSQHIILENMEVSEVNGVGVAIGECTEILVKNCDAHHLKDYKSTAVPPNPGTPGQNGTGFEFINLDENGSENARLYFEGCRAWNFSDNGFAGRSRGYVEWDRCWAFNGGELYGEGCGWKFGTRRGNPNPVARVIRNCIAAMNGAYGFSPNTLATDYVSAQITNNSTYHNGYKDKGWGYGFVIIDQTDDSPSKDELYANNLCYDNESGEVYTNYPYNHTNNSWDLSLEISEDDFMSLDWKEMLRPRKADGSLPDINFLRPKEGSKLIDAGIDVGLPYTGDGPDLGAFEFDNE